MIIFLLVLISLLLALIARGLFIVNENLRHYGKLQSRDMTDVILLLRGTKAGVWSIHDRNQPSKKTR